MTNQATALEKKGINTLININMDDLMSVADLIFKSGVFGDIQSAAQAAMKVLAGKEVGFDPFQSQSMFDFIQKRTVLNAHGKATLINSSSDYRLHTKELTPKNCVIDVLRKNGTGEWKTVATRTFTWQDAVDAGYTTGANAHSYKKTPRNMLFARNVSNIWRWDCAELNTRKPSRIEEFETPPELLAETASGSSVDYIDAEIITEMPEASAQEQPESPDVTAPELSGEAVIDAEVEDADRSVCISR